MPCRARSQGFTALLGALVLLAHGASARADLPDPSAEPAAASAPAALKTGAKAPPEDVRTLFEKGIAATDQGKLTVARDLFARAWELKKSWDVAANLGIVERKLGGDVEAAEHLSFALGALPPSEPDETRKGIEHELAPALAAVVKITVRAGIAGAEVRVAGRLKGVTPLDGPVFASPGATLVELRKDGYEPASKRVDAKAGGAAEVSFTLRPLPSPVERSWTAPAVAFGFGGAGALTAAVAGTLAAVKLGDLRRGCAPDLVCPESLRADAEDGRTAAHLATAGVVLAGAGLAVGIVLLVVPNKSAPARVGVSVGPGLVSLKGAF